jgi:hypothetical protein
MSGGALAGNIRHMISEVYKNGSGSVTLASSGSVEDVQRCEYGPFRSGSNRGLYGLKLSTVDTSMVKQHIELSKR